MPASTRLILSKLASLIHRRLSFQLSNSSFIDKNWLLSQPGSVSGLVAAGDGEMYRHHAPWLYRKPYKMLSRHVQHTRTTPEIVGKKDLEVGNAPTIPNVGYTGGESIFTYSLPVI
jgi:hypothetical protein